MVIHLPSDNITTIDLIRHGQPQGGSRYRGHRIDDPLSEKGWQQMRDATAGTPPWDIIISSPMLRCQAFADELGSLNNIAVQTVDGLKEVGFGHWEGKTREEVKQAYPQEYEQFYQDPVHSRPKQAEPLDAFIERVTKSYNDQLQGHCGKHLLIVCHAGVMRAIISHILLAPAASLYHIQVQNAGITRIQHNQHGGQLLHHNVCLRDIQESL